MAHLTAFIKRKSDVTDYPDLLIVEGTNMVDPFSASGGAPFSLAVDDAYVKFCTGIGADIGGKFLKVVPKPRQATVVNKGSVVDGRAGGKKKFYGVVHNVWDAQDNNFKIVGTKNKSKIFGCSFEDIAAGKMTMIDLPNEYSNSMTAVWAQSRPHNVLAKNTSDYHRWFDDEYAKLEKEVRKPGAFPADTSYVSGEDILNERTHCLRVCLPLSQFTIKDKEALQKAGATINIFEVSSQNDRMVVASIPYGIQNSYFPNSIKGRVGEKGTVSTRMVSADSILRPFVGHRGPVYPGDSIHSSISSRYFAATGKRLPAIPHVCAREQVLTACGKCKKHNGGRSRGETTNRPASEYAPFGSRANIGADMHDSSDEMHDAMEAQCRRNMAAYEIFLRGSFGELDEGHENEHLAEISHDIMKKLFRAGNNTRDAKLTENEIQFLAATTFIRDEPPRKREMYIEALRDNLTMATLPREFVENMESTFLHHRNHADSGKKEDWEFLDQKRRDFTKKQSAHKRRWLEWLEGYAKRARNDVSDVLKKARREAGVVEKKVKKAAKKVKEVVEDAGVGIKKMLGDGMREARKLKVMQNLQRLREEAAENTNEEADLLETFDE